MFIDDVSSSCSTAAYSLQDIIREDSQRHFGASQHLKERVRAAIDRDDPVDALAAVEAMLAASQVWCDYLAQIIELADGERPATEALRIRWELALQQRNRIISSLNSWADIAGPNSICECANCLI